MDPTEKETEIAKRYIRGEYTDVQLNYLAHQCGSNRERMDCILEEMSTKVPMAGAAKFILFCIMVHFVACTVYSLIRT